MPWIQNSEGWEFVPDTPQGRYIQAPGGEGEIWVNSEEEAQSFFPTNTATPENQDFSKNSAVGAAPWQAGYDTLLKQMGAIQGQVDVYKNRSPLSADTHMKNIATSLARDYGIKSIGDIGIRQVPYSEMVPIMGGIGDSEYIAGYERVERTIPEYFNKNDPTKIIPAAKFASEGAGDGYSNYNLQPIQQADGSTIVLPVQQYSKSGMGAFVEDIAPVLPFINVALAFAGVPPLFLAAGNVGLQAGAGNIKNIGDAIEVAAPFLIPAAIGELAAGTDVVGSDWATSGAGTAAAKLPADVAAGLSSSAVGQAVSNVTKQGVTGLAADVVGGAALSGLSAAIYDKDIPKFAALGGFSALASGAGKAVLDATGNQAYANATTSALNALAQTGDIERAIATGGAAGVTTIVNQTVTRATGNPVVGQAAQLGTMSVITGQPVSTGDLTNLGKQYIDYQKKNNAATSAAGSSTQPAPIVDGTVNAIPGSGAGTNTAVGSAVQDNIIRTDAGDAGANEILTASQDVGQVVGGGTQTAALDTGTRTDATVTDDSVRSRLTPLQLQQLEDFGVYFDENGDSFDENGTPTIIRIDVKGSDKPDEEDSPAKTLEEIARETKKENSRLVEIRAGELIDGGFTVDDAVARAASEYGLIPGEYDPPPWSRLSLGSTVFGGADTVSGSTGSNTVVEAGGVDTVSGGADTTPGGVVTDSITSGVGSDTIISGGDNDAVTVGDGDDTVVSGDGEDTGTKLDTVVIKGKLDDNLGYDWAEDTLTSGGGNDTTSVGGGQDTATGGITLDTVVIKGKLDDNLGYDWAEDTLTSGSKTDTVVSGTGDDKVTTGGTKTGTGTVTTSTPVTTSPPATTSPVAFSAPSVAAKTKETSVTDTDLPIRKVGDLGKYVSPLVGYQQMVQQMYNTAMDEKYQQPPAYQNPSESSFWGYGQQEKPLESIFGSMLETPEVKAATGGSIAALLAVGGASKAGRGSSTLVPHSGKMRVDFRRGDAVTGPGDGQSDDIPAMLADGEFVFPADVVSALGNGSTKAGSDKLYEMMHSIRARARKAHPKSLPPPAKSPLEYLRGKK